MKTIAGTSHVPSRFRKILRGLAYLMLVVVALASLVYVLNCRDEELKPEVAAMLKLQAYRVADRDNGFFLASALHVHSSLDALAAGKELFHAEERRFYANPAAYRPGAESVPPSDLPRVNWNWGKCMEHAENCLQDLLTHRAGYESMLASSSVLLQRYRQLLGMPDFEERTIPAMAFMPGTLANVARASGMNVATAALEIADGRLRQGMDRLENNSRFLHLLMRNTTTLISRTVAVRLLSQQTRVLSELMARYPQLVERHGDALARSLRPLSMAEQDFTAVFQNEARFGFFMFQSLDQGDASADDASAIMRLMAAVTLPLTQKNVLCNMYYDGFKPMIEQARLPPSQYASLRQASAAARAKQMDASNFPYVNFISKSIAKILIGLTPHDSLLTYMERSADLDGYLRLVSLQLALRQSRIAEQEIPVFIGHAAPELRNPYDDKPMQWNAKDRQLEFMGRGSDGQKSAAKIYVAPLH